jgi:hypothetical protein
MRHYGYDDQDGSLSAGIETLVRELRARQARFESKAAVSPWVTVENGGRESLDVPVEHGRTYTMRVFRNVSGGEEDVSRNTAIRAKITVDVLYYNPKGSAVTAQFKPWPWGQGIPVASKTVDAKTRTPVQVWIANNTGATQRFRVELF